MKKKGNVFDKLDYTTVEEASCIETENVAVKLNCIISELSGPTYNLDDNDEYRMSAEATFTDESGSTITAYDLSKTQYIRFRQYFKAGKRVDIYGKVTKFLRNKIFVNSLTIEKVRLGNSPLRMLRITKKEDEILKNFLAHYKRLIAEDNWALLEELKRTAANYCMLVGIEHDDILSDGFEAIICQAYSSGGEKLQNSLAKIHVLVIGPSAAGKKLFWKTAELMNIVHQEAQGGKTSVSGIAGGISLSKNKFTIVPGRLSMANNGIFGFQDFDKLKEKDDILAVLGKVMEDGVCIVTGIAKGIAEANTSIYLDVNRKSDTKHDPLLRANIVEDISVPIFILSRFDLIFEMKKEIASQLEKSLELFRVNSETRSGIMEFCDNNDIELERFCKILNAYINCRYKIIDHTKVNNYIAKKFKEVFSKSKNNMAQISELAQFQMRMAVSVIKLTHALTRLQLRKTSNKKAVDKTFQLLQYKFEFLKNFAPAFEVTSFQKTGSEAFRRWLIDNYGQKAFSANEVIKNYEDEGQPCGVRSKRALRYWISKYTRSIKHNRWKIQSQFLVDDN